MSPQRKQNGIGVWLGVGSVVGFLLWGAVVLLVLPPPEGLHGADVPLGFVGDLDRSSRSAFGYLNPEWIRLDDDMTRIYDLRTGFNSDVAGFLSASRGCDVSVLRRTEAGVIVAKCSLVFFISRNDRIEAITTTVDYSGRTDELVAKVSWLSCPPQELHPADQRVPKDPKRTADDPGKRN